MLKTRYNKENKTYNIHIPMLDEKSIQDSLTEYKKSNIINLTLEEDWLNDPKLDMFENEFIKTNENISNS